MADPVDPADPVLQAVDPGERNYASARWSAARGFHAFQVVDLRQVKGDPATKMHALKSRGFFDGCTHLVVERQMRSKFKEMVTAMRCFHWDKTTVVAPQTVKRMFRTGKGKHALNKKAHVELALTLLDDAERARFLAFKPKQKLDDLADCVVMLEWAKRALL